MSRLAAAAIVALVAAVVSALTFGLMTLSSSSPQKAGPNLEMVQLTETLVVNSGDVIRDRHFVWKGPPDSPMIRLVGTQFARLDQLVFEVPDGGHATAAVELSNTPAGGPFGNHLSNLKIGRFGAPANIDYGLLWTDALNGDSNTVTNVTVFGPTRAGVSISNPQATANTFRAVYVYNAQIGFRSEAGGTVECENCGFIGSTDVDVELTNGAGLVITGMYSEKSRAFARISAGPGGGGLSVLGGYWQWSEAADGFTITGLNTCCFRSYLRLTDFVVTPLDGRDHGTVTGFPPEMMFLSNIAGIAVPEVATR